MGEFLTGHAVIEQTSKRKIWKLLENVLYQDSDNRIYIAPRNFNSDLYTIPTWIDLMTGNSSEHDARCCLIHDLFCSTISAVIVALTKEELLDRGYLKFSVEKNKWLCADIPKEYLLVEPITKGRANDIFGRSLKAAGVRIPQRWLIRFGVCFNVGFYLNQLLGRTRDVDLNRFYDADFWDFVGSWEK